MTDPNPPDYSDLPSSRPLDPTPVGGVPNPAPIDLVRQDVAAMRQRDEDRAGQLRGWALGIIAAGILGFGGTALVFWTTVQSDQARNEEVHQTLRRELEAVSDDQSDATRDLAEIRRDVSLIKASASSVERGQDDTARRLERIERALDGRRGHR